MTPCILSGTANETLAENLSKDTGYPLISRQISTFANQELKIRVQPCHEHTFILQSFSQPVNSHIIEFLLLADAAKRSGARYLTAILPWYGYSKQDKVFQSGEPLSAKVIARLIQTSHIEKLITCELHNPSIAGYFDIPVVNLSTIDAFSQEIHGSLKPDSIVVSPDAGSIKSSTNLAHLLGIDVVHLNKKRDLNTGEVTIEGINRNIDAKHIIIMDDMIATGDTLIKSANFLKFQGAESIKVYATHHLYIDGVQEKLDQSPIDQLVVSDTIAKPAHISSNKLAVIPVSPLLQEAIK
jgi:ribose-phosphate pyrophosphokinase